jgi:hypothetical protein
VVLPLAQLGRYRQETHAIRHGSTTRHREKYKEHYDISGDAAWEEMMTTPSISQQTVLGARAPACVTGLGSIPRC